MTAIGLWHRVTVQWEQVDPDGKTAGSFRAHQRAWAAALVEGCRNLLVLEEDVFFDAKSVEPAAAHANAFIEGAQDEYDMLLLGWAPAFRPGADGITTVAPSSAPCVYHIHAWLLMHACELPPAATTLRGVGWDGRE
eukprot:4300263-Prymnesium_polylepis.1